jgi:PLP dependent protein
MPYANSEIEKNILSVRERISAAAHKVGRDPDAIELMAVTKFQPAEAVLAAYKFGILSFGENRVQEAYAKYEADLRDSLPGARLAMIGHLQSNKIGKAVSTFDCIQSVDSLDAMESIAAKARSLSKAIEIFLEFHTGEESKAGFPDLESIFRAIEAFCDMKEEKALTLRGLMTIAPNTTDTTLIRASFAKLRDARDQIIARFSLPEFGALSMGMSSDLDIAVEEGSTLVRVGTAIFGARA